ncbi:MAG: hypothetical protein IJE17_03155, partial [Clostridia bacterium]|nr:hypothetical protein [Clostridia bacterium]
SMGNCERDFLLKNKAPLALSQRKLALDFSYPHESCLNASRAEEKKVPLAFSRRKLALDFSYPHESRLNASGAREGLRKIPPALSRRKPALPFEGVFLFSKLSVQTCG